ncbi:CRISPR-associated endonuclease/helicase Cas3 [Salibacterium salarium]|uniref:CRISPR-associated helicase Cas3' n=1 Tax=Salibacterium salarium TaxID=284579 RepID=UPI00278A4916|nr:CRISPR-associated helicase Cas3' [Salibacterium salarium]MDQ0300596.1 CRISPR-associated endonuclease/helicase Cas3 [Salibacterium salarium]
MNSIAHIRASDGDIQTVEEHLLDAKALAEGYGERTGMKHMAGLTAMLHDVGKYTEEFNAYITEAVQNPDNPPKRGSVDHATAGGKLLYDLYHSDIKKPYAVILTEVIGNAIISHHSYLQDFIEPELTSPFLKRVRDKEIPGYERIKEMFFERVMNEEDFYHYVDKAVEELKVCLAEVATENYPEQLHFISKFVFSTIIDADRTNTRQFEEKTGGESEEAPDILMARYYEKLMQKVQGFQKHKDANSPINTLRTKMSEQCDKFAENPSGIYTLSIPTGGGKTLASLRYALKHAMIHDKKRIIYVVPFTTIIEQNAKEVRDILNDHANILEHHSNVVEHDLEDDEASDGMVNTREKLRLARDNWDAPVIFTTMVQFLNVFYEKGNRNVRRLHHLSDAILIFDEVQKVPTSCVSLFNQALNFLQTTCRSSIVLCTATQPALDFVEQKLELSAEAEMIQELDHVIEAFSRVKIVDHASEGSMTNDDIVSFIQSKTTEVRSMLVILNTKSVVKQLYMLLKEKEMGASIYHLSTSMCAAHRQDMLKEIHSKLENEEPVICVTTQLIEAGVDIDFDCVIRSLAGLDSIAQAAGRCNRNGKKELQYVYVMDHLEENLKHLSEIRIGKEISMKLLKSLKKDPTSFGGHLLSRQAMKRYFYEFYSDREAYLHYHVSSLGKNMTDLLNATRTNNSYVEAYHRKEGKSPELFLVNSYNTAASHFSVIDNQTMSVLVPFGEEGAEMIAELNGGKTITDLSKLLKNAQQYSINVYRHERKILDNQGALVSYLDGSVLALTDGVYSDEFGLDLEGDDSFSLQMY